MSSSSRPTPSLEVNVSTGTATLVVVLGGLGWIRVRRREVGKAALAGPRGVVDAVADDRPIAGVHEQREDLVHHVVVERTPTTGLVWTTLAGGKLDLEEGTLLGVGLADVDDEVV